MDPYVLYAMPGSLYSAKARAYLRTHRIAYVERAPGDHRYTGSVVPAIGRWIIPVLQTPGHADPARRRPSPRTVRGEGLLRPAMHYRWDFDDTNVAFPEEDFSASLVLGGDDETREGVFAFSSDLYAPPPRPSG